MTALVTLDQPFSVKTRQRPLQMFLASNKDNDEVGPVFFYAGIQLISLSCFSMSSVEALCCEIVTVFQFLLLASITARV